MARVGFPIGSELSSGRSKPNEADLLRLKRFARYLKYAVQEGHGVGIPSDGAVSEVVVASDTDWAGDEVQRKSCNCYLVVA